MVRLKGTHEMVYIFTKGKFQFLMVRLKDNLYCIVLIRSRIFQFLMVRLKAPQIFIRLSKKYISIPYGAIKRLVSSGFVNVF